jgi:hypothetical protein
MDADFRQHDGANADVLGFDKRRTNGGGADES